MWEKYRLHVFFCLSLMVFSSAAFRLMVVSAAQLRQPVDLSYESPNLLTIRAIQEGRNIYDPAVYADVPFVLTIYPPLYHYLVAWLPTQAGTDNPFWTGRVVSLMFLLLTSACLFCVDRQEHCFSWALLGTGVFWLLWPVTYYGAYLKNDSLALFLAGCTVVTAFRASNRSWVAPACALLSCLALAGKQSYVAAPAACALVFFCTNRARAGIFLVTILATGALLVVVARIVWGGGIWFSLIGALRQPFAWAPFATNCKIVLAQPLFSALLGISNATALYLALASFPKSSRNVFFWYLLMSEGVLLATLGKLGAGTNYFLEPALAALLFLTSVFDADQPRQRFSRSGCLLAFFALLEVASGDSSKYCLVPSDPKQATQALAEELAEFQLRDPKIVNLYSASLGAELPGEVSVNDPYLYSLLWQYDQLPGDSLERALSNQYFDLVLLNPDGFPAPAKLPGRALPRIYQSLAANYQLAKIGKAAQYWKKKR